jgi:hypothetical protein
MLLHREAKSVPSDPVEPALPRARETFLCVRVPRLMLVCGMRTPGTVAHRTYQTSRGP